MTVSNQPEGEQPTTTADANDTDQQTLDGLFELEPPSQSAIDTAASTRMSDIETWQNVLLESSVYRTAQATENTQRLPKLEESFRDKELTLVDRTVSREWRPSEPKTQPPQDQRVADDAAIARALSGFDEAGQNPSSNTRVLLPSSRPETKRPRRESFDDLLLRLTNEFSPVIEKDWDTLIYIGPPPQEHGQDDSEYEYIRHHFSKPYLMNSRTLKETGSAHFTRLLGPTSARAQRKLKKLGVHHLVPGNASPKFYMDLRPPQDDDEAVLMITEMECPRGVLAWHRIARELGVDRALVCGKDQLNTTRTKRAKSMTETEDLPSIDSGDDTRASKDVDQDLEPGYSALRHHMAIERLLHTIGGGDPKLNSAPKLWNYFAIAKYFDCLSVPRVKSEIFSWLFADQNANFIQHNTEVAYRMAFGLKAQDLAKVAFATLVGNQAWLHSYREHAPSVNPSIIPKNFLRYLDDDEVNRVDHAAQSLLRRLKAVFMRIANNPISWMVRSPEMLKLFALHAHDQEGEARIAQTRNKLCAYVRGEIYRALSQNLSAVQFNGRITAEERLINRPRAVEHIGVKEYNRLSLPQRLLTHAFWSHLKMCGFYQDTALLNAWSSAHNLTGLEELAPDLMHCSSGGDINTAVKADIADLISEVNHMMFLREACYSDHTAESASTPHNASSIHWADIVVAARRNLTADKTLFVVDNDDTADPYMDVDDPNARLDQNRELVRALHHLRMDSGDDHEVMDLANYLPLPPRSHDKLPETMLLTRDAPLQWRTLLPSKKDRSVTSQRINKSVLMSELCVELRKIIELEILKPGWTKHEIGIENDIPINELDTLVCLDDNQWKFLPLWAGGCDDGTGGVFLEHHVPDVGENEGFKGGKRGLSDDEGLSGLEDVEMGEGGGYSVINGDGSDFEDVKTEEAISTVGRASHLATDGTRSSAATVISLD